MFIFVFGFDASIEQFYLMMYVVIVVGMLFTGALGMYHFNLICNGTTAAEREKNIRVYDLGWKENLREVFGERWYLVWIFPYVKSPLPSDGVSWIALRRVDNSEKGK